MSNEPTHARLLPMLEGKRDTMAAMLPPGVPATAERIIKSAMYAVTMSPQLQQCDPKTVVLSVLQACRLGLDPGGALGEAYLVPYKDRCQLIPGYQGLISIARRSGAILGIEARVVCEGDYFEFELGMVPRLEHRPPLNGRGVVIGVYAVATLEGGHRQIEVMGVDEVNAIRARSHAGRNGPWVTDFAEMAKKTVIRRIFKSLPKSLAMMEALVAVDAESSGRPVRLSDDGEPLAILDVEPEPAERPATPPPSAPDLLARTMRQIGGEARHVDHLCALLQVQRPTDAATRNELAQAIIDWRAANDPTANIVDAAEAAAERAAKRNV